MTKKKELRNKFLEEEMKKNLLRRNSKKSFKNLSIRKSKGVKNDNNV
tara:strand:- start:80 stop:220 length:141 start_codon:yes stop_codon:yes gene_type:complete